MSSEPIIPKIIHFVWAGGKKIMPNDSAKVVAAWAAKYPDFEIWLWVDKLSSGTDLLIGYGEKFEPFNISVFDESFMPPSEQLIASSAATAASVPEVMSPPPTQLTTKAPVVLKDIGTIRREGMVSNPIIREMIDCLRPNYGASSDCIRYRALLLHGGFYADSDVMPGKSFIKKIERIGVSRAGHVLYVDHQSQQILSDLTPDLRRVMLDTFNFTSNELSLFHERNNIGNDTFLCTRSCPVMSVFDENVVNNYRLKITDKTPKTMKERIDAAYGAYDIRDSTIKRTGPVMVKNVLSCAEKIDKDTYRITCAGVGVEIKRARCREYELTEPMDNTTHWLQSKIERMPLAKALAKAQATIQFEIEHFQIIRLDDHILDIARAAGCNENEAAVRLIEAIQAMPEINHNNIRVAQLLHTHPETKVFYAERNLLGANHEIIEDNFVLVANLATSRDFFDSIDKNYDEDELIALDDIQKLFILDRIFNGFSFIQHVTENPQKIDIRSLEFFKDILKKYIEIMKGIDPDLGDQFKLQLDELKSLKEKIKSEIKERESATISPITAAASAARVTVDKTTADNEERSVTPRGRH